MNLVLESHIVTSNDVSTILFTLYNILIIWEKFVQPRKGAQGNVLIAIIKFVPNILGTNLSIEFLNTTATAQVCYLMLRLSSMLVKMVVYDEYKKVNYLLLDKLLPTKRIICMLCRHTSYIYSVDRQ